MDFLLKHTLTMAKIGVRLKTTPFRERFRLTPLIAMKKDSSYLLIHSSTTLPVSLLRDGPNYQLKFGASMTWARSTILRTEL